MNWAAIIIALVLMFIGYKIFSRAMKKLEKKTGVMFNPDGSEYKPQ